MKHTTATLIAGAVAAPALMVAGAADAKTVGTTAAVETMRAGCTVNDQSRTGLKLKALSPSANYVSRQRSCSHSAQA